MSGSPAVSVSVGPGWGARDGETRIEGQDPDGKPTEVPEFSLSQPLRPAVNIGAKARVLCSSINDLHLIYRTLK